MGSDPGLQANQNNSYLWTVWERQLTYSSKSGQQERGKSPRADLRSHKQNHKPIRQFSEIIATTLSDDNNSIPVYNSRSSYFTVQYYEGL